MYLTLNEPNKNKLNAVDLEVLSRNEKSRRGTKQSQMNENRTHMEPDKWKGPRSGLFSLTTCNVCFEFFCGHALF